ncbi:uncharacterized protein LOC126424998 [Schistocerca serialis cubense]|uniref:uncharacterized protein LOC126424998 n=1 Tax=Schistocerca serialis cubense TaxID=2023355 RepID=UPI00214E5A21|nr:uncharacterized protein LOC126424998 [Schistocerca serialis cubense]
MDVATHCCYAWSLGTGTIIIGVLNMIGSILQIAAVAYNWDLYQYANDDISGDNSHTKREVVTVLVFGIIQAICSVLLITGAVKVSDCTFCVSFSSTTGLYVRTQEPTWSARVHHYLRETCR